MVNIVISIRSYDKRNSSLLNETEVTMENLKEQSAINIVDQLLHSHHNMRIDYGKSYLDEFDAGPENTGSL